MATDTPPAEQHNKRSLAKHRHFLLDSHHRPAGEVYDHHINDFYPVSDVGPDQVQEFSAAAHATEPATASAEASQVAQRILFGKPIPERFATSERLDNVRALAILSSDALSSVAYGTEAALSVLIAAGVATFTYNLWIGLAIAALMLIVGNSYRQTLFAYPRGGGSYTVASQNLNQLAGLVAAGALLIDYLLTVAVSVAAGIDAIASAIPALQPHIVQLDVIAIVLIVGINLRGVREAGTVFAIPTYFFLISFGAMIVMGLIRALTTGGLLHAVPAHAPVGTPMGQSLSVMLILTAFASGCSAMTGVEAISNSVPAFKGQDLAKQSHNAARTLMTMILLLVALFLGTTYLAWRTGAVPYPNGAPTVTSQIAQFAFGTSWLFYIVQIATLLILIFAANTSFAGFPRLAAILARDQFLPPFFMFRGERLAFNTGILTLGALSIIVLVAFKGNVADLINLYALGVFTAFTLSQTGMVRHWQRKTNVSHKAWRMAANGVGAVVTGIVTVVIAVAKFDRGAWVVLILVPLLVLAFLGLRHYYARSRTYHFPPPATKMDLAIVPVITLRDLAEVVRYAQTVAPKVIAVRIVSDATEAESFRRKWNQTIGSLVKEQHWPVQLNIVEEPYRMVILPLARFVEWHAAHIPPERIALLLPRQEDPQWWEWPLHRRIARRVRAVLVREKDSLPINILDLPYTLKNPRRNSSTPQPASTPQSADGA
jgi:amino acid transporter